MSNYELQSTLSSLESQLRDVERQNAELQREINAVTGAMAAADTALVNANNQICNTLDEGSSRLASAHNTALAVYELQGQIGQVYERLKHMELANKKIRECFNQRYYDFGTYRTVRKIVQGVMDNLDMHMVREELLEKAIEKRHLMTPDYWLTCALIAIAAWRSDSRERAQRAVARALELDKKRTASFFLVFNLRMRRDEAAIKWFEVLRGLELVGSDRSMILLFFSMLSRSINEKVAESTRSSMVQYIDELIADSMKVSGYTEDEVVAWIQREMVGMCRDDSFSYSLLQKYCTDSERLKRPLVLARNNKAISEFYGGIMSVDAAEQSEYLKAYVDQIVGVPAPVEVGVYEEIDRNEAIIRFHGDIEAAQADFEQRKSRAEASLNVVAEMLRWVFDSIGAAEANPQMRLSMLSLTKEMQISAAGSYAEAYRSRYGSKADLAIDDFSVSADLASIDSAKQAAVAHYEARRAADQAAVKDTVAYGMIGGGVVAAITSFFTSLMLLIVAAIALVGGIGYIFYNKAERQKIAIKYETVTKNVQSTLDEIAGEYKEYAREYTEYDLLSARLLALLESL